MLPSFYRDPVFSVPETAAATDVTVANLRTWLARGAMSFVGRKIDGQLRFTGHEVYFFAIMRALTGAGWSPPIAMYQAYPLAGAAGDRPPGPKDFALAGVDGKRMTMQLGSPEELAVGAETAGTILPLPKIWRRTMDALARECAAENRNHICL